MNSLWLPFQKSDYSLLDINKINAMYGALHENRTNNKWRSYYNL
ncbi:hypothetical protein XCR1_4270003 [Xenorhabdus cabanillasii JM26]|uniref:Uncharacterized protein n=1 Tax=Xenorhabdus cabanillasii JM26 TaxID=1427517 RepID=W1J9D3_9GAMM|nr:hypothetical protein XCR1_4270003 [Xenorhabdus cabanillasii JM26]